MAEHLLDAAEVGSALEQMRREGMAKDVRVDALGLEPCLACQAPQDEERSGPGERPALGIQEELCAVTPVEVWAPPREVAAHRLGGLTPKRHDPLLVPLAHAADQTVVEIDGRAVETDRFAYAQAGPVEELHEGTVPEGAGTRPVGRVDQTLYLPGRERPREPGAPARKLDLSRRVVFP